ncbi:ANTAR domain-containing response regulator [Allobaculum stercoricanis]|uniref:ANTAR domain-containing response regulator n=1 Tax=Allobaculum stercoricanis TaxID=174709 RepID=UPI0023F4FF18|nr:ANTAR domain-containing protein [Allobaculum stercoricanis]
MSLKERVYSTLIVSAAERFNRTLAAMLPTSKYSPIHFASNISAAKRALTERSFDFVIINSPLPDDVGTRFAIDSANSKESVVLLMVGAELQEEIYDKVAEHGVFVLSKPISKQTMVIALSWLSSAREKIRKTEKKTLSIEEKMQEIRIVNRAKWILIRELKFDEPEAHRYIEKQAMDRCISKRIIAEEIIRTYS